MRKFLTVLLIIGIVACVLFYFGGQYTEQIKEFITPEEAPESEILNDYEEITEAEALTVINKKGSIASLLDQEESSVLDVQEFIKNYSNQFKLNEIFISIDKDETVASISTADIENIAMEKYGSKDVITHEDIICIEDNLPLAYYNAEEKTYTINMEHEGHGAYIYPFVHNHAVDFKKENNAYVLTVTKALTSGDFGSIVYNSYADYKANINALFDIYTINPNYSEQDIVDYFEENYGTLQENLVTYKYKMIKENDKITILSYEILE